MIRGEASHGNVTRSRSWISRFFLVSRRRSSANRAKSVRLLTLAPPSSRSSFPSRFPPEDMYDIYIFFSFLFSSPPPRAGSRNFLPLRFPNGDSHADQVSSSAFLCFPFSTCKTVSWRNDSCTLQSAFRRNVSMRETLFIAKYTFAHLLLFDKSV